MASKLEKLKTKQQEVKLPGSRKQKTRVEGSVLQVEHKQLDYLKLLIETGEQKVEVDLWKKLEN